MNTSDRNTTDSSPANFNKFQQAFQLHQQGQLEQADLLYQELLKEQPQHIDALHFSGVLAHQLGQSQRAVDLISQSLKINPDNAAAHSNLGLAIHSLERFEDAIACYDKSLAIKPDNSEALYNRGNSLLALNRFDPALASYERALVINPDYIEALSNRGMVLRELKRFDEALDNYKHILTIKPDSAEAEHGYAVISQDLKRYSEAIIHYGRALAIKPDLEFIFGTRLYLKMNICDWSEFDDDLDRLAKGIESGEKIAIPFAVLAMFSSCALQKKAACCYTETKYPGALLLPAIAKHTHSKIKIAYFSADFRQHPVSYLTAELFERHDRSQFEIIAFSFHETEHKDDMRLRLEAAFDQFIDVSQQSDEQVVQLARELEIDIAVDLNGNTEGCRTGIFAMRVAPVQVNYLGYSGTMGAEYMDYLLADSIIIPAKYQSCYTEKIACLPDSFMVNDSTRAISDRKFTRTEFGLPEQGFVFCCFNNAYKIAPTIFDIWMRILHEVEGSVLWLSESHTDVVKNLQQEARKRGIAIDRLVFAKRLPLLEDHLARHRLADLFLDTLPYNAHTTSSDALWAGLPVLTCTGEAFASRVAASLLTAIGLPELITSNHEDYEARAIQLATHPEQLAAIKQKLANNRLSYPLFNIVLFTQHIESAYQAMFDRYQAGLAPEHIYLSTQTNTAELPTAIETKQHSLALTSNTDKFQQAFQLQQQGQLEPADLLYQELLKEQPQHIDALHFSGVLAHQLGQSQRAVDLIRQALELDQNNAAAHSNLGLALKNLNRFEEALASYDHALAIAPNDTEALSIRGIILQDTKRFDEALKSYQRVLDIKPDSDFIFGAWLHLKMIICDWDQFDQHLNRLAQGIERGEKIAVPFLVLALSSSLALQNKVAEIYTSTKYPKNFLLPPLAKHSHSKIKIAYFSSDFRQHPVSGLTAELFEQHDKSRFEIIAFSFSPTADKDDMRLRLEAAFDQFIDVTQQSDEQVARLARQLEIDIAIDLNGFTQHARTGLFAMRVAPVQVNYLGYPGTMGADYMDYLIASPVLIPAEYRPYYVEKIVYLPNNFMINANRTLSDRKFTRTELGLPEQGFVFCCFNNNYKITPAVFASWMRILHQVEGSVLWLLEDNNTAAKNLRLAANAQGIAAERIVFAQRLPMPEYLTRHQVADLFLDTLPYNAHTTASSALWSGLPVLTCTGETFPGRMAAGLLDAIGLPELISSTVEDYEALAIQLATHPEQLAAIKQKLANNRLSYPLFNSELFTQRIEQAYQAMFDRYQAGLAPDHIGCQ